MAELLESFDMGSMHKKNDPKCPFCPAKTNEEHYVTYSGEDNDGGKLGEFLDDPKSFAVSKEADARPKNGKKGKDGRINQSFKGSESYDKVKKNDSDWEFQAHHAISGNQCLKGNAVEKFILGKKGKVKYDTGYSVNNPQNGIWLPSFPAKVSWPDDPDKKFELAKKAMKKFNRQFHLGHHNISVDVDGLDVDTDYNYAEYVKLKLKELNTVLTKWEIHCPEKESNGKHLGNTIIHNALDRISGHIINILKASPKKWKIFVSRHARDYTIKKRDPTVKLDFE